MTLYPLSIPSTKSTNRPHTASITTTMHVLRAVIYPKKKGCLEPVAIGSAKIATS
jgi:hypothetical protein